MIPTVAAGSRIASPSQNPRTVKEDTAGLTECLQGAPGWILDIATSI